MTVALKGRAAALDDHDGMVPTTGVGGMAERGAARRSGVRQVAAAAGIVALVGVTVPFASRPVSADSSPLAASVFTLIIGGELLTACLLFQRYRIESDRRLLSLGGTYLLTGLMFLARQLTAPGVVGDKGLIPAPMQSGMWLWIAAHTIFPLGIIVSMLVPPTRRFPAHAALRPRPRWAVGAVLAGGIALVALFTAGVIHYAGSLPPIMAEGAPALLTNLLLIPVAVPLLYWRYRRRDSFERWIIVALAASTADVVLTTLGMRPYTVGWLAGRLLSVAAASVLLIALVGQITRLYRELAGVHERLAFQAAHDMLTGALTRRALMERIDLCLLHANGQQDVSVLAIVDVDHLKTINDGLGHLAGDHILGEVAARMRAALRSGDVLGRYGGDEFVIFMPAVGRRDGEAIAGRILEQVRARPIAIGARTAWVTATIGLTTVPVGGSVDALLERADTALYEAKRRGRDQLVFYDATPAVSRLPKHSIERRLVNLLASGESTRPAARPATLA
ncbi:MAG: GGDEF domain-containing protein [Actinomycetota bacterium]|nr:GGDEF domain-containing protein [Actinomycetota bacterium]